MHVSIDRARLAQSAVEQSEHKPMSAVINQKEAVAKELERIEEDCVHSGKAHFNAGIRWARYHYFLGVPSVVFSPTAGAAFLKNFSVVAAIVSTVVTVLAALMTFLKPSERALGHKSSGDQYLSLRNDARIFRGVRLFSVCDDDTAIAALVEFTKRRNELNNASASFSRRDYEKARDGVDAGEAAHRVDTKPQPSICTVNRVAGIKKKLNK